MRKQKAAKPKLTDAERHKLFLAMARETGAEETPESFDRAFKAVVKPSAKPAKGK